MDLATPFPVSERDILQNMPFYQRTKASLFLVYKSAFAIEPLTLKFECDPRWVTVRLEDDWQEDEDIDHLAMIRELLTWVERLLPGSTYILCQIELSWGLAIEQAQKVEEKRPVKQYSCYVEARLLTLNPSVQLASA
ncbi:hypothetical protein [Gloeobacter kilaueensis]|uniref:Uncharacterized protein n=1 Tax=Gloeobacter kilaueensis (strain ATCC BAA-2537 / CCAP 1431/1 / ULC 316 / JS1) TaxID=1183438 RepID=U5QGH1_GLOK1|nr:hypothetical protein [Gloeobacter kilaueensis]AGY57968.1 hypothetical protein GKIL_1722 [Gloeobacter kilaueensis JS1]